MTDTATRGSLAKIRDDLVYYQHQLDGIRQMAKMTSCLLADEMGLGKSIQALTVAAIDFQTGRATKVLVVCPATLKQNWGDEIEQHTFFTYEIVSGNADERRKQIANFNSDILIINYELVGKHINLLNDQDFDIIIYDEAHYMKNRNAARTKGCKALKANRHLELTGSPLMNKVDDLWVLLNRIDPVEWPNYWRFINRYCNTPDAPIWMADGTFKPIGKVQVGDEVLGWVDGSEQNGLKLHRRKLALSVVEAVHTRIAPMVVKANLQSGRFVKCTPDHVWLSGNHNQETLWAKVATRDLKPIGTLSHVIDVPVQLSLEQQRAADWLAGVYDGEASRWKIAQCINHNPEVHARICRSLDILGIPYTATDSTVDMRGGRQTYVNLLNWTDITRNAWLKSRVFTQLNRTRDRVVSLEKLGPGEVVSMQTSTGNYIAWGYASRNCLYGGYKDKQIIGVKNEKELNERLAKVMLRRYKRDTLDLPEKQYIRIVVDLTTDQRELYDKAVEDMSIDVPGADPMEIENALVKFLRLKQICGTTACIPGHPDHSIKLDRAVEMIQEILDSGEPVVVFTQFREVQRRLVERLEAKKLGSFQLHGDTPMADRVPTVREWTKQAMAGNPSALVCMIQVGGVGLNMTAASKCIFIDKDFSPKKNEQAADRLHRIGADKTRPVQIFELFAKGTVEARVETILRRKTKVFGAVVDADSSEWKRKLIAAVLAKDDAA